MEPAKAPLHVSSKRVGDGSSAMVHIATLNGREVAAKVSGVQEDNQRQVRREARRYARLRHPGILRCLGVAETGGSVVLVTELMRGGSLFHALRARNGKLLPRMQMIGIAIQISRALAFVHNSRFSSGDVKSLNVLLSAPLEEANETTIPDVKLCDFGLSRRLGTEDDTPKSDIGGDEFLWGTTVEMDRNAVAGTFAYLAPECFERPATTPDGMKKADVFALGVVLWELATCDIPWAGLTIGALIRVVKEKRTLPISDRVRKHAGNRYIELVEKCWSDRPDVAAVAVELEALYEASPASSVPHMLYSDVSTNSTSARGALRSVHSASSLTSDESAAIASITSVDDGSELDHGSFDIALTLFPDYAREVAEKRRVGHTVPDDSDSDSDTSAEFQPDDAWDNDEDVVVFGNVDDLVDVPLNVKGRSPLQSPPRPPLPLSPPQPSLTEEEHSDSTTLYSSSTDADSDDDSLVFGEVVEVDDDYKSPAESSGALDAAAQRRHVHFGETLTTTFHVSSAHERLQQAPASAPPAPWGNDATMEGQDGVYMPEEFAGAGPGFLDATNELSEFSFTFQDGSSHEGPASGSRTHAARLKEDIAASLERRQSTSKHNPPAAAVPPAPPVPALSPPPARPATVPLRYSPHRPPRLPLALPKSPVRHRPHPRTPLPRDYTSPPIPAPVLTRELARFEDEDANHDVLNSVMQFSRFVQRRY